ncbi:hypothetical protein JZX93_16550 [Acidomonas methanolica]|nr:hypothetical protein [Acidomonas methanolica]MCQ9157112.1 hypothetical protein [Acidomonas methanolica]
MNVIEYSPYIMETGQAVAFSFWFFGTAALARNLQLSIPMARISTLSRSLRAPAAPGLRWSTSGECRQSRTLRPGTPWDRSTIR